MKGRINLVQRFGNGDAPNFIIDGHYPLRELWGRARNCWDRILEHESKSVLVVAHNAVNQALVATAIGLGTEYFRILLQSNCGVSVLDFTPRSDSGSPSICLNHLNQTPSSPIAGGVSGGRKASKRVILVCHGTMNMLGMIQSQKTAELLLNLKVGTIISSTEDASTETAMAISRVQEAADCLGAYCVPRYVEMTCINDLDVTDILHRLNKEESTEGQQLLQPGFLNRFNDEELSALWDQSGRAWQSVLDEIADKSEPEKVAVVVSHPAVHIALMAHCLKLTKDWMGSFHLDAGSISVLDFPDGATGSGVVRSINYTAHLGRWSIPISRSTVADEEF